MICLIKVDKNGFVRMSELSENLIKDEQWEVIIAMLKKFVKERKRG